jgi:hypothetical protein
MRTLGVLLLLGCLGGCHPAARPRAAAAPLPAPPQFCAASLGVPDCFADPALLPDHPMGLADGPWQLTPEQEADKKAWWRF